MMKKRWKDGGVFCLKAVSAIVPAFVFMIFLGTLCGIRPYITLSGSMEPKISTGSVCFVNTKADYEKITEGDIIAFETSAGALVTHRVCGVTLDGLETKGDANDVSDGIFVTADNFRGKTLFSIPYLGYGITILKEPPVKAVLLFGAAAVLWSELTEVSEKKKKV